MEMIKGIIGHGYYDELVVPIIENSAREYDLTDSLAAAVSYLSVITLDYPKP
jgi:methylthioribulose 1-phosphate dehydratase/enolase-phosphatase E1